MNANPNEEKNKASRITGKGGEDAACRYLYENGYKIIARNYKIAHDEIDIIAENEKYIVFVEVKTRTEVAVSSYGRPASAVDLKKRKCIARAAGRYLRGRKTEKFCRFDVIEVLVCSDRTTGQGFYKLNHMKGVFGAGGKIWI